MKLVPQNDHLDEGGEAVLFKTSTGEVIKWYHDQSRFASGEMARKINHLAGFRHPYAVSPQGLVRYNGNVVGYWMPFCAGDPLIKVADTIYRKKIGLDDAKVLKLVERMRDTIHACHAFGIVLADPNELNWMMVQGPQGPEPRLLDLDSSQVKNWKAYGVAPIYQDYHTRGFTEGSDWYTFAIVSFKLWTGIHPFMGNHPRFNSPKELEPRTIRRMKEQVSVLNPLVKVPKIVKNARAIPPNWLSWYEQMFHSGVRSEPPTGQILPFTSMVPALKKNRSFLPRGSSQVRLTSVYTNEDSPVIRILPQGVVLMKDGTLYDVPAQRELAKVNNLDCEVINWDGSNRLLADRDAAGVFRFHLLPMLGNQPVQPVEAPFNVTRVLCTASNRLMAVMENGLADLRITMLNKPYLGLGQLWSMPTDRIQWFEGLGIFTQATRTVAGMAGGTFLVLPESGKPGPYRPGVHQSLENAACHIIRVPELDGLKPVTAKAGNGQVVVIATNRAGNYVKVELVFLKGYGGGYTAAKALTQDEMLNITMLPKGVCVALVEDGTIALSAPRYKSSRLVHDADISTKMELHHWDDRVVYLEDGEVWEFQTKPTT